jgi:hypothetical protein
VTVLKRLRKYRHALTGALLPVLAFVWVGAAAAPCVAMQAPSSRGASMATGHAHRHDGASASLDTASSGEVMPGMLGPMPSSMDEQDAQGEHPSTGDPHRPCPHCPPDSGHTAPHVACAMATAFLSADDILTASAHDLGHAMPPVDVTPGDEALRGQGRLQGPERRRDLPPSVPLNLRYCVFLN